MSCSARGLAALLVTLSILACSHNNSPLNNVNTSAAGGGQSVGADFDNLALGDIETVDLSGTKTTLDFSQATSDDEYLLVINATDTASSSYNLQWTGDSLPALTMETKSESNRPEDTATQFHQLMRESENIFRETGNYKEATVSDQAGLQVTSKVGEERSFRVLSSLNSITAYKEITATLKLASDDVYVYLDKSSDSDLPQAAIDKLASEFAGIALPLERALFGPESDINADGHITILMTCVLNQMSASGGLVTGFFFPGDLYQRNTVNPVSNAQEILYTLVPDPSGKCGTPISVDFTIKNILPGVLAHEYQHMNSFNQHVFVNHGSTEEPWLNECLSHVTEDLTGFGNENPSRIALFLSQTSSTALIPSTPPNLAERGACYLFLRYLYEQSEDGPAFLSRLYGTSKIGIANLEQAFAGTDSDFDEFPEFLSRWSIALGLSETGVTSDPRYNYQPRAVHLQTGNLTGICTRCDTQDGRGTVLGGPVMATLTKYTAATNVKSTATQFYRLRQPSGKITLNASGNPTLVGAIAKLQKN